VFYASKERRKRLSSAERLFRPPERTRIAHPDGKVGHAELQVGDSVNMLSNEFPEMDARVPQSLGGSPVSIRLYVENADAIFNQAVAAGAKVVAATVLLSHEVQI
jgi:PhnB protein